MLTVSLIVAVVAGCAEHERSIEAEEQKNQQIVSSYAHITKFFDDCVERSARRQYRSSGDLSSAIDYGFSSCRAEESAVIERMDVGVKTGFGQQQIGPYKFRLKQRLLQTISLKEKIE